MADEETPQEEQPKRRRRRSKASDAPEEASASSAPAVDELEPTAADEEAADEAADVVLEAEAEVDQDTETEAPDAEAAEVAEVDEIADADEADEAAKPRRRRPSRAKPDAGEKPAAAKPAPTRRRAPQRDPSLPPPVVRAQAKYVRSSARKARLVCDHIRGKSVGEARAILAHTPRAVARDWSKLLESAIANAENNHELVAEDLYIKTVQADEGPTIKRFRPRAMGRATRIRKRTSHLTILLTPKE
jgi:ribosomal protein L22